jgi:hypothetical protein
MYISNACLLERATQCPETGRDLRCPLLVAHYSNYSCDYSSPRHILALATYNTEAWADTPTPLTTLEIAETACTPTDGSGGAVAV